jgi:hypothetical protein
MTLAALLAWAALATLLAWAKITAGSVYGLMGPSEHGAERGEPRWNSTTDLSPWIGRLTTSVFLPKMWTFTWSGRIHMDGIIFIHSLMRNNRGWNDRCPMLKQYAMVWKLLSCLCHKTTSGCIHHLFNSYLKSKSQCFLCVSIATLLSCLARRARPLWVCVTACRATALISCRPTVPTFALVFPVFLIARLGVEVINNPARY